MVRSPVVSATPTLVNVDMHDLSAPEPKSATPTLSTGAECRTRSSSQEEDVEKGDRGLEFPYAGAGNSEDPFVVRWLENDPEYPFVSIYLSAAEMLFRACANWQKFLSADTTGVTCGGTP